MSVEQSVCFVIEGSRMGDNAWSLISRVESDTRRQARAHYKRISKYWPKDTWKYRIVKRVTTSEVVEEM